MIVLQAVVAYVAVLVAPGLIGMRRGGLEMVPIYRFGVIGAMFHVLLLGAMVVIFYFDLRRVLLAVAATSFVLNLAFAIGSLWFGPGFQGYGYFLATLLTLMLATILASRVTHRPTPVHDLRRQQPGSQVGSSGAIGSAYEKVRSVQGCRGQAGNAGRRGLPAWFESKSRSAMPPPQCDIRSSARIGHGRGNR